jgi:hypothetical protein
LAVEATGILLSTNVSGTGRVFASSHAFKVLEHGSLLVGKEVAHESFQELSTFF